jgi:hypothetical protein
MPNRKGRAELAVAKYRSEFFLRTTALDGSRPGSKTGPDCGPSSFPAIFVRGLAWGVARSSTRDVKDGVGIF